MKRTVIAEEDIARQEAYMAEVRELNAGKELYALVDTYGCPLVRV